MVYLTRALLSINNKRRFLDRLRINVKSGTGGNGLSNYGGIGGRGGNIYLSGNQNITLKDMMQQHPSKKLRSEDGHHSSLKCMQGKNGEDIIVNCPLGTSVVTDNGVLIGEVDKPEEKILIAKGGAGGSPKNKFIGEPGHHFNLNLDLKLIADISLVGFPNVGKSSLIKSLSRATPKIAPYPFTTFEPKIVNVEYPDKRQITMADLPGLIEGAHLNKGMGHRFLKHIERTKLLLIIVDVFGFRLSPHQPLRSSFENVVLLNKELELYKKDLIDKPSILVVNKMDIPGSDVKLNELLRSLDDMQGSLKKMDKSARPTKLLQFDDILTISAKEQIGTDALKVRLRELLDYYHEEKISDEAREKMGKEHADYFKLTNNCHIPAKFV